VSAGLGEAGVQTVVQVFHLDRGEVVDAFVGSFGVEPEDLHLLSTTISPRRPSGERAPLSGGLA
jgi:hypothetical protein